MDWSEVRFRNYKGDEIPYDGSEVQWRVSAYGIMVKDEKVLLVQMHDEEFYDVFGGGVEMQESVTEALVREAREEAGAEVRVGELVGYVEDYFYHKKSGRYFKTLLLYFSCDLVGELGIPREEKAWVGWVGKDAMDRYPMMDYLREMIGKVL